MVSLILYCGHCYVGYGSVGEIPARCPSCDRVTKWVSAPHIDPPTVRYELTRNDKRLLTSLKISED